MPHPGEELYKALKKKGFKVKMDPKAEIKGVEQLAPLHYESRGAAVERMGSFLSEKYPKSSLRRAKAEVKPGESATVGSLVARRAIRLADRMKRSRWAMRDEGKDVQYLRSSYLRGVDPRDQSLRPEQTRRYRAVERSMKKRGLLGLGLTAASLGSSIKEAKKK